MIVNKEQVTVDLSGSAFASWAEAARISTEGGEADCVFIRLVTSGAGGGTDVRVRCIPAWDHSASGIQGTPLQAILANGSSGLTNGEIIETGNGETIAQIFFGNSILNPVILPPYVVIEVQEDQTTGTARIEALALKS